MRILLLSNPNSCHTLKWVRSLVEAGIEIGLFSINKFDDSCYRNLKNVKLFGGYIDNDLYHSKTSLFKKVCYLKALPGLLKTIKEFKPDIVHSHFISSYGILGMLSCFTPHITSVWGTDIFDFPKANFIQKNLIKLCLKRAQRILSTSYVMAKETNLYTNKNVEVTPFGIDLDTFKKKSVKNFFEQDDIVVGTVKTMSEKYGIKYLVQAFAKVKEKHPDLPLKLLLVGGGDQSQEIKELIKELKIDDCSIMTGPVPYDQVSNYHNMLSVSVSVSVSNSESFGVAIIEAGACEKPVVVSNVGGLPEVVEDGVTGIVVPPRDIEATANAIEKLVLDKDLREKMGKAGRARVKKFYDWNNNVKQMISIYESICGKKISSSI